MLKFLLLFVIYVVFYFVGMFTVHVIHYFVKRREYKDDDDLLNRTYKVKENARAEMLREIFFGKWFKILVSKRYTFKKLLEQLTERELREAFMDKPVILGTLIVKDCNGDLAFRVSKDFKREVEKAMNEVLVAEGEEFDKDEVREYLGL